MKIYVLNHKGNPIMQCSPRKARRLLKEGKVDVVKRTPFTIKWKVPTRSYTQPITLGVDSGYSHVGLSAISDKEELYSAEVVLRDDIVKLISERKMYRKNRRYHKLWYRKARFLNRSKPKGWLAPSIQHKLDSHIKVVDQVKNILPISDIVVEVAAFDIQKIKNPNINGVEYQQGEQEGFWNVREYVLYRDGHKCQHCKGKSKDKILNVHHIESRQTGGNRPSNLITLCKTCHEDYHKGLFKLKVKTSNGFKAEAFMSMVRWRIVNQLKEMGNQVRHTYGYFTKSKRIEHGLPKSHINDAYIIAGGNRQLKKTDYFLIKQIRKCNRKLFKGSRSHIKNKVGKFLFGFQIYDKVLLDGVECFIYGRRTRGYFDIRKLDGEIINKDTQYKKLSLLESTKSFLVERRT